MEALIARNKEAVARLQTDYRTISTDAPLSKCLNKPKTNPSTRAASSNTDTEHITAPLTRTFTSWNEHGQPKPEAESDRLGADG